MIHQTTQFGFQLVERDKGYQSQLPRNVLFEQKHTRHQPTFGKLFLECQVDVSLFVKVKCAWRCCTLVFWQIHAVDGGLRWYCFLLFSEPAPICFAIKMSLSSSCAPPLLLLSLLLLIKIIFCLPPPPLLVKVHGQLDQPIRACRSIGERCPAMFHQYSF